MSAILPHSTHYNHMGVGRRTHSRPIEIHLLTTPDLPW